MIALVMSVSLPMTTYAANWYLEDGSVTVNVDNSGQTVTQGSNPAVSDEAPVITQRESSVETGNTIAINASDQATANVTIKDINIKAARMRLMLQEAPVPTLHWRETTRSSLKPALHCIFRMAMSP